jgi:CheY-like chemotaxis protein
MVVEDELLLASMIVETLEEAGYAVRGPYPKLSAALAALEREDPVDIALLDVNLRGEEVFPLAAKLQQQGTPFAFCTGYAQAMEFPPEFSEAPVVAKPFTSKELRRVVHVLLGEPA